jgi:hypothetical protein
VRPEARLAGAGTASAHSSTARAIHLSVGASHSAPTPFSGRPGRTPSGAAAEMTSVSIMAGALCTGHTQTGDRFDLVGKRRGQRQSSGVRRPPADAQSRHIHPDVPRSEGVGWQRRARRPARPRRRGWLAHGHGTRPAGRAQVLAALPLRCGSLVPSPMARDSARPPRGALAARMHHCFVENLSLAPKGRNGVAQGEALGPAGA